MRRAWHRISMAFVWTVFGLAAGVILSISLPQLFGYRTYTVLSGSMEPTLHTGDIVLNQRVSPLEARVGDVVTFRDPENKTRLITHRVRSIQHSDGLVRFVTKGDANNTTETWAIAENGTIGRARFHVWKLGYALFFIGGRYGRLAFIVVPSVLLGWYELRKIWRRPRRPAPTPEEAPNREAA